MESATAVDPQHPVALVVEGTLAGVTSRVSLEEFDEAALPQRLGDAAWVEQKVRAHEQVLEGVLEAASVVPCRFCTVYRTEAELRSFLAERNEELTRALARVAGRVELGVKAFVDRDRFAAGNNAVRELAERVSQAEGGRAYLESRRLDQLVGQELAHFGAEVASALDERLLVAVVAVDLRRRPRMASWSASSAPRSRAARRRWSSTAPTLSLRSRASSRSWRRWRPTSVGTAWSSS